MSEKSSADRTRVGLIAGIFGVATNTAAFLIKIAVGIISGSVTVAADAFNSFTDAGSSVLTMIGFRLAAKPADSDHPFGHARYEQITALIISLVTLAVGVLFAKSSAEKIAAPADLSIDALTYTALAAAVLLKVLQAAVNYRLSKKISSVALRAAAVDSRNDALITSSVLLSVLVMGIFDVNIDGWAGLAISVFIVFSAAATVKSAISPMLGSKPPKETVDRLTEIVLSRPEILGCHDLYIHNYGSGADFASIHAVVDPDGDIVSVHRVVDGIEREVGEKLGIKLTIHVDTAGQEDGAPADRPKG